MAAVAVALAGISPAAQTTTPPAQTPERPAVRKPAAAPPKTTSVRIGVRDQSGAGLSDVRLILSGAATGEYTTGAAGTAIVPNIKDGLYRVRCEHDGYVTLEREFSVHGGAWNPIDIVLSTAPAPPPPPPPPPAPAPKSSAAVPSGGAPVMMSVPDYLDRNFIGGREPIKESVVACKPAETVRLLQMRENVATHTHDRFDEIVYVVAGEGAVKIGDETTAVRAGSLVVVPNGNAHAFERRGKNPLIVVSTLTGSACEANKNATP
jgi:hypothetical protein